MFSEPRSIESEGETLLVLREDDSQLPNHSFLRVSDERGFACRLEVELDRSALHWRRTSPCCGASLMSNASYSRASCADCWTRYAYTPFMTSISAAAPKPYASISPIYLPAAAEAFHGWYEEALDPLSAVAHAEIVHAAFQAFSRNLIRYYPSYLPAFPEAARHA